MTREEAAGIVAYMNAAFPKDALEGEVLAVFTAEIGLLADPAIAREAAQRHAQNDARFPSIASLRATYRSVAEARRTSSEQFAIPEETGETPTPLSPEGWEKLAQAHRELRARDFGDTDDPAAGTPLPRNRAQFNQEWATFVRARFGEASPV